jgi:hypothetical protein
MLFALLATQLAAPAERDEIMPSIQYVAASLSEGNGTDAVSPFDKSTPGYDKLTSYFEALTDQARVQSDVELIDESGSDTDRQVTVRWTLEICQQSTGEVLERRVQELRLRLIPGESKKFRWKIVSLDPVEFFNPIIGKR